MKVNEILCLSFFIFGFISISLFSVQLALGIICLGGAALCYLQMISEVIQEETKKIRNMLTSNKDDWR
jgi:hypothetical protein